MATFFRQTKLSKSEWEQCEIPVYIKEKRILQMIKDGYCNLSINYNENLTLIQSLKIEYTPEIETFLFMKYFKPTIDHITTTTQIVELEPIFTNTEFAKIKQPKKMDLIRLSNLDVNIENQRDHIFEFILIDICKEIFVNDKQPKKQSPQKSEDKKIKSSARPQQQPNNENISKNIYTLIHLIYQREKIQTDNLNKWVLKFVKTVINALITPQMVETIFYNSPSFIEKNPFLLKHENKTLHDHQKQLFAIFANTRHTAETITPSPPPPPPSRLVFYTAPTGTGKTLSPIGLSTQYRIIYICASRHVGLAFAKNAISIEKKVAFAFGCETAADIRLHYFSAKDYEINKKSGGIYRVDNSNGEKVEIMICDVHSYLIAMYYMLSFNEEKKCIMYWDEPTISLDHPFSATDPHPLHEIIHNLWKQNSISNVVLSCATLPSQHELLEVISDFRMKFEDCEIHSINSHECKKTISLINKDKCVVVPHLFFENYDDVLKCLENCQTNKSILRYFNLTEIVNFVKYINVVSSLSRETTTTEDEDALNITTYFERLLPIYSPPGGCDLFFQSVLVRTIVSLNMTNIKFYYLKLLSSIPPEKWNRIYQELKEKQKPYFAKQPTHSLKKIKSMDVANVKPIHSTEIVRLSSMSSVPSYSTHTPSTLALASPHDGILLTTADAHTLTDGVSILFATDVEKIGRFMIHQSKIPEKVLANITEKIEKNSSMQIQIETLSKKAEDKIGKDNEKENKMEKEIVNREVTKLLNAVELFKSEMSSIALHAMYIPNTTQHQLIWCPEKIVPNAFVPNIQPQTVLEVMDLSVTSQMKLLLLMGIGVFSNYENTQYTEIVKRLCVEEKLYLIIADSDFIYGLNYQLCHSFFGKDLINMTQQKIIQAVGRIGRGHIQQEYTVRIRDDELIRKLFLPQTTNIEAENMCRLFCSF
jgi:hypothetical protein